MKKDIGVAFSIISETHYPSQLAFCYLDDLVRIFSEAVAKKYGSGSSMDVESLIETIDSPYTF